MYIFYVALPLTLWRNKFLKKLPSLVRKFEPANTFLGNLYPYNWITLVLSILLVISM